MDGEGLAKAFIAAILFWVIVISSVTFGLGVLVGLLINR